MPRPKTKDELLEATRVSYDKLVRLWDAIPPEQTCALFPEQLLAKGSEAHWRRDKCLRDVVIHLHEWHNLVTTFVSANYVGTPQAFSLNPTRGATTPSSTKTSPRTTNTGLNDKMCV